MGLNFNEIKFLLWAQQAGVDFANVMTIGRQRLYLNVSTMQAALSTFGIRLPKHEIERMFSGQKGFAEPFFRYLGAVETSSIDASSYEGASHVQDMNDPVKEELKAKFTVVLDSGSLEHVFNFPTAIRNCMEMVRRNGHFIGMMPCNNYMGHGFYQFSPELFFRIFTRQNGFTMEKAVLYEASPMAKCYQVRDSNEIGKRAEIRTRRNTLLFVQARRTEVKPLFAAIPQQSDYAAAWRGASATDGRTDNKAATGPSVVSRIRMISPPALKKAFWSVKEWLYPAIRSEALGEIRIPESK